MNRKEGEWSKLTRHAVDANTIENCKWTLGTQVYRWGGEMGAAMCRLTGFLQSLHVLVYPCVTLCRVNESKTEENTNMGRPPVKWIIIMGGYWRKRLGKQKTECRKNREN